MQPREIERTQRDRLGLTHLTDRCLLTVSGRVCGRTSPEGLTKLQDTRLLRSLVVLHNRNVDNDTESRQWAWPRRVVPKECAVGAQWHNSTA